MDEKITLEIRTRLDQLFSGYPASRELTELKEELVADLTEAVSEKVNDGVAVPQAIDAAMASLGDVDSLLKEITGTTTDPDAAARAKEAAQDRRDREEEQAGDDWDVNVDDDDDVTIGGPHGLRVHGDKVTWHGHTIVDGDQVHLGKLVQVDGDHVRVANGLVDVNGDDVTINGHRPQRTFVESLQLVNTRSFDVTGLKKVRIDYPDATVKIGPVNGDRLVVNEYMSRDNPRYFLQADQSDDQLTLRQGARPRLWSLHLRTEIFLPAQLQGAVTVEAGNGSLEIGDLHLALDLQAHATNGSVRVFNNQLTTLNLRATNGSLKAQQVTADQLTATSQNGSVVVREAQGALNVSSHNGSVKVSDFTGDGEVSSHNGSVKVTNFTGQLNGHTANGSLVAQELHGGGQFRSHHGSLNLDVADLTQDLAVNGAGNIDVAIATTTGYHFDLVAERGKIRLPQQVHLTLNDEHHKIGAVGTGSHPQVTLATDHGNIRLK